MSLFDIGRECARMGLFSELKPHLMVSTGSTDSRALNSPVKGCDMTKSLSILSFLSYFNRLSRNMVSFVTKFDTFSNREVNKINSLELAWRLHIYISKEAT